MFNSITKMFLWSQGFIKSIVWPTCDRGSRVISKKVKGQNFGSTGVKTWKMLRFWRKWSYFVYLGTTIQKKIGLHYLGCFVTYVTSPNRSRSIGLNGHWPFLPRILGNEKSEIGQTYLFLNCCAEIHKIRPFSSKSEHFSCFHPCRPEMLTFDLFAYNSRTVGHR